MDQYSNSKNDSIITNKTGKVDYSLTELEDGCDHPGCDTRRKYGIQVKKKKTDYIMNSISIVTKSTTKEFCPNHRKDNPIAEEARKKEHEQARKEWLSVKEENTVQIMNKIVKSGILPVFICDNYGSLKSNTTHRFLCKNISTIDEAKKFLLNSEIEVPVVLKKTNIHKLHIIYPNSTFPNKENKTYDIESMISYEEFEGKFNDYEFSKRDLFGLRSNILTGTDYNKVPVREIDDYVDEVVEWHEYFENQGDIKPSNCPACGNHIYTDSRNLNYSRVIIDGEEKIVVTHNKCGKISGELNMKLINKEAYEL